MKSDSEALRASRTRRIAGRAQQDHILDPYQAQQKLKDPTVCPECGAIYHRGRWQWGALLAEAHRELCPACRRIRDRLPAGVVTLHGDFARRHKSEIVGLARNVEAVEKGEHPLNRIIEIEETAADLVITTSDIHLPRRIAEAVRRAFRGSLKLHFDQAGYFLRADWQPPS